MKKTQMNFISIFPHDPKIDSERKMTKNSGPGKPIQQNFDKQLPNWRKRTSEKCWKLVMIKGWSSVWGPHLRLYFTYSHVLRTFNLWSEFTCCVGLCTGQFTDIFPFFVCEFARISFNENFRSTEVMSQNNIFK